MQITADAKIAEIATDNPATIKVFQRHHIDFCCGGKIALREACERQGIDPNVLLAELRTAQPAADDPEGWSKAPLADLIAHIQTRYHEPLRSELERLSKMLAKVIDRHGDRLPATLLPLQQTFGTLRHELLDHMAREDAVLFPLIVETEAMGQLSGASNGFTRMITGKMMAEHENAGAAMRTMRELTGDYTPPDWACPTFVGLYHGLAEFEREMHVHVHLENAILFPRSIGENP